MKNATSLLLVFIATVFFTFSGISQVTVDQSYSPQELVEDHLVGSGLGVSNVTFNGISGDQLNTQIGLYNGPSQFIEFDEGLVMASGDVILVEGGFGAVSNPNITGDPDLFALANVGGTSFSVNNCAILEFDFVPDFEFLTVGYVFASIEYPSFTCSSYNDVFGFFVSGPGLNGPFTNSAVNIALIPDTDIPVGVNTINSGTPSGGGSAQNCLDANPNFVQDSIYFVENNPPVVGDVQFPGMTTNLYANIILQPGETYHIKLAVSDVSDGALDSGVFLEGASFSSFPISGDGSQVAEALSLHVFPNPATSVLNVQVQTNKRAEIDIRILDVTGKVVNQPSANRVVESNLLQQIDISALNYGVYVLEMTDRESGKVFTERFQKLR